jgi:Kdo2-lipid IVA lauroyltransferase/acyltransferase
MKDRIEYLFAFFFGSLIRLLPWKGVRHLGNALGLFIFHVIGLRRRLTMENIRHAFPEKTEDECRLIASEAYKNLMVTMLEIYWMEKLTAQQVAQIADVSGSEIVDELLKEGKGLICVTGHCANWEFGAVALGLLAGHPITVIVQKQRNKLVDRWLNRVRSMFNNTPVFMEDSPREILRALRRNECVGIVADQSAAMESIRVEFFGRSVPTHEGPAVFSLRTGAPILMAYVFRLSDGRYKGIFEKIDMSGIEGSDQEKIRTLTQRHTSALEAFIRKHPGQWLWLHNRWKHAEDR